MPDSQRLYYPDSFLSEFTATVTDVHPLPPESAGHPSWKLKLTRTAFYPTSGGQPFDTGELIASSAEGHSQSVAVEQVEEDAEGDVWHFVRSPLQPGVPVEGRIHWERRFDHMQQHTGQHLLSAIFGRELNAPTVSFHLGEAASTIDVTSGPVSGQALERVERAANRVIFENRPVAVRWASRAEAEAMFASGELRKLPDRNGSIRLIEIAGCDLNACGGTHVRSTGQIGALLIRRVEKVSRGMRVEFVCGSRAVRAARADAAILSEAASLLSRGGAEIPAAIKRILDDERAHAKDRQKLREELATLQASQIGDGVQIENGLRMIVRDWKDRDSDYVRLLASRSVSGTPATAVLYTASEADPIRVFLARSADLPFHCGHMLRDALAAFGLRGGGSPDLAQGEVPAEHQSALTSRLVDAIRAAVFQ